MTEELQESPQEKKIDVVFPYCLKFTTAPSRTLARKILEEHPELGSLDRVRSLVRTVRGAHGAYHRNAYKYKFRDVQLNYAAGGLTDIGLSMPEMFNTAPVRFQTGKWLVLADTQMPWHEPAAIARAIQEGKDKGIDSVLLGGDISDSYQLSKFWRRPDKAIFVRERYALEEFFETLREQFPNARIVWKYGNHDVHLERYMSTHAPVLYDEDINNWQEVLKLQDYGVEVIEDYRKVYLGKLLFVHGHEFGQSMMPPVTPARWLFLRANCVAMCAHHHQTSSNNDMNADDELISTWSVGCLCQLRPRWKPITKWNHGFAIVNLLDEDGNFEVDNPRILPNGRLVR